MKKLMIFWLQRLLQSVTILPAPVEPDHIIKIKPITICNRRLWMNFAPFIYMWFELRRVVRGLKKETCPTDIRINLRYPSNVYYTGYQDFINRLCGIESPVLVTGVMANQVCSGSLFNLRNYESKPEELLKTNRITTCTDSTGVIAVGNTEPKSKYGEPTLCFNYRTRKNVKRYKIINQQEITQYHHVTTMVNKGIIDGVKNTTKTSDVVIIVVSIFALIGCVVFSVSAAHRIIVVVNIVLVILTLLGGYRWFIANDEVGQLSADHNKYIETIPKKRQNTTSSVQIEHRDLLSKYCNKSRVGTIYSTCAIFCVVLMFIVDVLSFCFSKL